MLSQTACLFQTSSVTKIFTHTHASLFIDMTHFSLVKSKTPNSSLLLALALFFSFWVSNYMIYVFWLFVLMAYPLSSECWRDADTAGVPGGLQGRPVHRPGSVPLRWPGLEVSAQLPAILLFTVENLSRPPKCIVAYILRMIRLYGFKQKLFVISIVV